MTRLLAVLIPFRTSVLNCRKKCLLFKESRIVEHLKTREVSSKVGRIFKDFVSLSKNGAIDIAVVFTFFIWRCRLMVLSNKTAEEKKALIGHHSAPEIPRAP